MATGTSSASSQPLGAASGFFDTDHLQADLKGRSVRGGGVTLGAQATRLVLRLGSTAVLARILTPADFGLIAMVTAISGFVEVFQDLGLSMATIQRRTITKEQISTLFWINLLISATLMAAFAATGPVIAQFYGEPRLLWVTLAVSLGFLFGGLSIQHTALLRRQMRFAALAGVQIVSQVIAIVVAVALAVLGARYWALVGMILAGQAAGCVGSWIMCGWIPGLPVRGAGVRSMLWFGGSLTAFDTLNYFARNLDNILIGRVWGAASLGFYSKAYNLLLLPLAQINHPIASVAIPALSSLQSDSARYRSYYMQALSAVAFLTAPLAALLFLLADEIILVILGSQWAPSADIFRLLAVSVLVQPVCNTTGWLYVSLGRGDLMIKYGAIGIALIVTSFFIGLPYGPKGVAAAYATAMLVWTGPCMYLACRHTPISFRGIASAVASPLFSALIAGLIAYLFAAMVLKAFGPLATLLAAGVLLLLLYLGLVLLLFDKQRANFRLLRNLYDVIWTKSIRTRNGV